MGRRGFGGVMYGSSFGVLPASASANAACSRRVRTASGAFQMWGGHQAGRSASRPMSMVEDGARPRPTCRSYDLGRVVRFAVAGFGYGTNIILPSGRSRGAESR